MNASVMSERIVAYAYAYGRVSGMEPKILSAGFLESLSNAKTLQEVVSSLDSAGYATETRGMDSVSREDLEGSLSKNFREAFEEVSSMIPDDDASDLKLLFHGEWDASNIKNLARRIHVNDFSRASESALTPLGSIDHKLMAELIEVRNTDDLYLRLPRAYKDMFKDAFTNYGRSKKLFVFENKLDSALVSHWLVEIKGELRNYVKLRVDSINILSALKCKKAGISPRDYLVLEGYYLNLKRLAALSDQSSSVSEVLAGTPYAPIVKQAEDTPEELHFIGLEAALRGFISSEVFANSLKSPLSLYSVMRFLELKVREYRTVRALVLGKHANLAPDDLKRMISWLQSAS